MRTRRRALALWAVLSLATVTQLSPAEASVMRPPGGGEACTYSVGSSGYEATAVCKNNNNHPIEFRAVIVCGLSWDTTGGWVTVPPGKRRSSSGLCDAFGTGVGSVSVDVRDL
ncbi:hypothetical protein [Streptomyces vilmorinianum]|uniref:hypothetical protein n=1 Tax=Streptomyces vilmorinianum TaxID=3051092 RepID=UPI0010FB015D|nr:hypothetical protein [Streptomyces vilmorinianum]